MAQKHVGPYTKAFAVAVVIAVVVIRVLVRADISGGDDDGPEVLRPAAIPTYTAEQLSAIAAATPRPYPTSTVIEARGTVAAKETVTSNLIAQRNLTATAESPLHICSNNPGHKFLRRREGTIIMEGEAMGTGRHLANTTNFDATITFVNPTAATWDYGLAFRRGLPEIDMFTINNRGEWAHSSQRVDGERNQVSKGDISTKPIPFRTGVRFSNTIRIIARGLTAEVSINGSVLTELTLDQPTEFAYAIIPVSAIGKDSDPREIGYKAFTVSCP